MENQIPQEKNNQKEDLKTALKYVKMIFIMVSIGGLILSTAVYTMKIGQKDGAIQACFSQNLSEMYDKSEHRYYCVVPKEYGYEYPVSFEIK